MRSSETSGSTHPTSFDLNFLHVMRPDKIIKLGTKMLIITAWIKSTQNMYLHFKYESLYSINSLSDTLVLCVFKSLAPLHP